MQDRPAAGECIGGRTGRRGDDQAVGAQGIDEFAVHLNRKFDHGAHRAATDHHIIEGNTLEDRLAAAPHLGVQHQARFLGIASVEQGRDQRLHLVLGNVGEKPQRTEVDPDNRHLGGGGDARHAQQGTVTTHRDGQVSAGDQRLHRQHLVGFSSQQLRHVRVGVHAHAAPGEQALQGIERLGQRRPIGPPDNRDRLEFIIHFGD